MRAWILVSTTALSLALAGAFVFACDGEKIEVSCKEIPDGGCPRSGDADICAVDPTCQAVYACTDLTWSLVTTCGPRPFVDAAPNDGSDGAPPSDASFFDGPLPEGAFGGPGCEDLQAPDCSLGLAATCGQGCCGCEDLFVCSGGAWNAYGYCQNGQIVATP